MLLQYNPRAAITEKWVNVITEKWAAITKNGIQIPTNQTVGAGSQLCHYPLKSLPPVVYLWHKESKRDCSIRPKDEVNYAPPHCPQLKI